MVELYERKVWEKLAELEKSVAVLEGEDYDPFGMPSDDARRRAKRRVDVERGRWPTK